MKNDLVSALKVGPGEGCALSFYEAQVDRARVFCQRTT